jgi:hypothetical protein
MLAHAKVTEATASVDSSPSASRSDWELRDQCASASQAPMSRLQNGIRLRSSLTRMSSLVARVRLASYARRDAT